MKGVGSNLSNGGPLRSTKSSDERLASRSLLRVLLSVSFTAEKPLSHSDDVGRYVLLAMDSFCSVSPGASSCNFQSRNSCTASWQIRQVFSQGPVFLFSIKDKCVAVLWPKALVKGFEHMNEI